MFKDEEEGQALVETALSMALFIIMMLGLVEFGRLAFAATEVSNAAKAAAQYASQNRGTAANIATIQSVAQNEYFGTTDLTLVSPTATTGYACICANGTAPPSPTCGAANNAINACPGSSLEITITVQTQATFNSVIHIPGLPSSFTLHGTAVQKVLQ